MFKKVSIFILIFMFCFSIFIGCSQTNNPASQDTKDQKEGLVMAIGGEPDDGFDPTTGWGRYGSPLFQSTLLKRDSDLHIINDLATNYSKSEDGLVWTFQLREDVRFSDGKPLTAKDVVYTYETAAKSNSVVDLSMMKSVEALDDYTVQFTLKHPQSTFVNIAVNMGIVPRHAHNQDYAQNPMGSGPYKFLQWDKGQQLMIEANPEYYGKKPYFKKITFLYLTEEAAFAAAKAGKVDVAAIVPALAKQEVKGMKLVSVASVDNRGIAFPSIKSGGKTSEGYPIGNDVTADLAIRKAINIALDRKALVDGVVLGHGSPAYTVCDQMPWWNPETVIKDGDIEGARKILSDAGWQELDGDGILDKDGRKAQFTLIYPSSDQTRQFLAIAVADMIKPLGIQIDVEGKSWDQIETLKLSNALLLGWGSHDPLEMYNLYHSKYKGKEWYNTSYYANVKVDDYMEKALAAVDEEEANDYWKKAQWDGRTGFSAKGDAPWAWLINMDHLYLVKEGLNVGKQRIQPHSHGWPILNNIEEWHWDE
ncbi:ABC transporter substrate-binding protein [Clostridiaceae bacterium 35-E11]